MLDMSTLIGSCDNWIFYSLCSELVEASEHQTRAQHVGRGMPNNFDNYHFKRSGLFTKNSYGFLTPTNKRNALGALWQNAFKTSFHILNHYSKTFTNFAIRRH